MAIAGAVLARGAVHDGRQGVRLGEDLDEAGDRLAGEWLR